MNCEICGKDITRDRSRCTNQRCGECHAACCTPGGSTSPGHGRGSKETINAWRLKLASKRRAR